MNAPKAIGRKLAAAKEETLRARRKKAEYADSNEKADKKVVGYFLNLVSLKGCVGVGF